MHTKNILYSKLKTIKILCTIKFEYLQWCIKKKNIVPSKEPWMNFQPDRYKDFKLSGKHNK